jgi:hypothetical protein
MIAEEVIGVDVDTFDDARQAQFDDAPVVTGAALSAAFPAVHPFAVFGVFVGNENASAGLEQVLFFSEEFIAANERFAAQFFSRQVN